MRTNIKKRKGLSLSPQNITKWARLWNGHLIFMVPKCKNVLKWRQTSKKWKRLSLSPQNLTTTKLITVWYETTLDNTFYRVNIQRMGRVKTETFLNLLKVSLVCFWNVCLYCKVANMSVTLIFQVFNMKQNIKSFWCLQCIIGQSSHLDFFLIFASMFQIIC